MLFSRLAAGQLDFHHPRVITFSSDGLSDSIREIIEQKFGIPVFGTYQAVEALKIGFECEQHLGYHLNIDLCAVSMIDDRGHPVAPGQPGELVVSNLYNRAMVLLNYRLGDLGVMSPHPRGCGRNLPLLEQLVGKTNQILALPDGRKLISGSLEMLFPDELRGTLQAQISQRRDGGILWRIVPIEGADRESLAERLRARTRQVLEHPLEVEVEFVSDIPRTAGGKIPRIVADPAL